jgi:hypothetical protein
MLLANSGRTPVTEDGEVLGVLLTDTISNRLQGVPGGEHRACLVAQEDHTQAEECCITALGFGLDRLPLLPASMRTLS